MSELRIVERIVSLTFDDGFSMIKGDSYWIGSDACEYDDPYDYLMNGSPVHKITKATIDGPPYFEDHEVCGYCMRQPGEKHANGCRQ